MEEYDERMCEICKYEFHTGYKLNFDRCSACWGLSKDAIRIVEIIKEDISIQGGAFYEKIYALETQMDMMMDLLRAGKGDGVRHESDI